MRRTRTREPALADQVGTDGNYVWRFLARFAELGSAEAIVADPRRLSFADLRTGTLTMAATLREHGFRSGSAVAILAGNSPEAVMLHLALHLLGCRTVWIASAPREHQRAFLALSQVERYIYDPVTRAETGEELAGAAGPVPVFCLGPGGLGPDLVGHRPAVDPPQPGELTDEPQSLFQTSGTTGQPKLVQHRQRLFQVLPDLAAQWLAEGRPVLRHLGVAGHWHVATQMTTLMVLSMGGTVVMLDSLDPPEFLALLERERANSTVFSPPILYALLDEPRLASTDLSSLAVVTCGGGPVAPARLAQAVDRLGPVLRIVYAMSESPGITELPVTALGPEHPERVRSVGLPYADVQLQIRDPQGGELPAGQVGEVWVRSVLVMDGYWDRPELTRQALVDGWLHTGDVGYRDSDGFLYLVGRSSEVIVTGIGATNVYPRPIEDRLVEHPEVRAAAVIGVPDPEIGEALHAFVVRAPGSTVTGPELRDHVAAGLNDVWAPREVEFMTELPLLASGKVDRAALRASYAPAPTGA